MRKREPGSDLSGRIAQFNHFDVTLNADERRVPLVNVFTGTKIQFRTTSWRGQWSPKILLSPAGPILVMFAKTSVRQPAWLAYGPLAKEAKVLSALLGEGGRADIRAKELVRCLGSFVLERPKQGLPTTMQSRFSKFHVAVIQLGDAC